MATVEFYSKAQVDAKIPSAAQLVPTTSGATSGDVLTFDGSSVGWVAAGGGGGGDVWEELDLTNLPNDFQVGDEIEVTCHMYFRPTASVASWASDIAGITESHANQAEYHFTTKFILGSTDGATEFGSGSAVYLQYSNCLSVTSLRVLYSTTNWNSADATKTLFGYLGIVFNGKSCLTTNVNINRNNISDYILSIKRKSSSRSNDFA